LIDFGMNWSGKLEGSNALKSLLINTVGHHGRPLLMKLSLD